jgi:serine/threonine protein kinase
MAHMSLYCTKLNFGAKYNILEALGKGTTGTVYKVENKNKQERDSDGNPIYYAAKIIYKVGMKTQIEKIFLMREFQITRQISFSPNVVKLYRSYETYDQIIMLLSYSSGGNLD